MVAPCNVMDYIPGLAEGVAGGFEVYRTYAVMYTGVKKCSSKREGIFGTSRCMNHESAVESGSDLQSLSGQEAFTGPDELRVLQLYCILRCRGSRGLP